MISKGQLSSRFAHAAALLRKDSVKAVALNGEDKTGRKVQTSWGSAMRR